MKDKQHIVTLNENEWLLVDKKLGIFVHKTNESMIRSREGVYDLDAIKLYKKHNNCNVIVNEKMGFRRVTKFPYYPTKKQVFLTKDYTETELHNICKFAVALEYEYLGQPIDITRIIKLCHTGK